MKVPKPMRRLRFRLDVCFTSRGELVGGELICRDSEKPKSEFLGGWSGTPHNSLLMNDLLRQISRLIDEATIIPAPQTPTEPQTAEDPKKPTPDTAAQ